MAMAKASAVAARIEICARLSQELGPGRVGSLGSAKSGGKTSLESRGRVWAGSGLGPGGFVMEIG